MICVRCGAPEADAAGLCAPCRDLEKTRARGEDTTSGVESPRPEDLEHFAPGQHFGGRYTIVEEIGSGGMGRVYKALDTRLRKPVALKLIASGRGTHPGAVERFRRELTIAQEVSHPNVCRVHDLGSVGPIHYISMEYVEGQTLEDLVHAVGHLSPEQALSLGQQLCTGLAAIHEKGIVHRDLKPGNIMVDRAGRARLMDFGLAYRPEAERLSGSGVVLGTLAYASPEQSHGESTDERSDIYSMGVILFEMLTGKRPPGDGGAPLSMRLPGEASPPPSRFAPRIQPALDAAVLRCLERAPEKRFARAQDLGAALARIPQGGHARRPALAWAIGGLLALGLLGLVFANRRVAPRPPVTVAFLPLVYEGPPEGAFLKTLVPYVLGDALRDSKGVSVVSFATTRTFDEHEDPLAVGRQLAVASIVHGRVTLRGDRVEAELDLSREGAGGFRKSLACSLTTVTQAAERAAEEIAGALGAEAASPPASHGETAMERYLAGKAFLEGWDVEQNYTKAEDAFASAIAAEDGFAEAHAGLAGALKIRYDATQDPALVTRALAEAKRAVALSPSAPEAQVALGVVELWKGLSVEAAQAFETAQRLAPADDAVSRHIGDAYASLGRDAEAERFYRRAIDLRPGYWENYNGFGKFCVQRGKLDRAKEMFSKVIELRPQSNTGYNNKAATHLMEGQFKEAEPLLLAALRISDEAQVHSNLGVVYYATGRMDEAAREFRKAIEQGYEQLETYGNLGDAYRQLGRRKEAREAYTRAVDLGAARLRVNPDDGVSRAGMAMFLAGEGQCPDARREAQRSASSSGDLSIVHYYAAVAYALCGDRTLAVQHTAKAIAGGAVVDVRTSLDLKAIREEPSIRELLR
jgi:tetratricopeptide (TPR) repeat protein/tRNA A-37 threonylcarbamoyl transferase component Bud32